MLTPTGSTLAGTAGVYKSDVAARERLRQTMHQPLFDIGIKAPQLETWIEFESKNVVHLGTAYSSWAEWPIEVAPL